MKYTSYHCPHCGEDHTAVPIIPPRAPEKRCSRCRGTIALSRSYFVHCWGGAFYIYSLLIVFGLIAWAAKATSWFPDGDSMWWLYAGVGALVLSLIPLAIGSVIGGRIAKKVFAKQQQVRIEQGVKENKLCPKCGFSYKWDGVRCGHCDYQPPI